MKTIEEVIQAFKDKRFNAVDERDKMRFANYLSVEHLDELDLSFIEGEEWTPESFVDKYGE